MKILNKEDRLKKKTVRNKEARTDCKMKTESKQKQKQKKINNKDRLKRKTMKTELN